MNVGTNEDWGTNSGEVVSIQTPANPIVVDTIEMGESELEGIQDLPPLSSHFLGYRFWSYAAMFPLLFIVLNELVFFNLFEITDYKFKLRNHGYNHGSVDQSMSKWNLLVVAIMSFVDSIVLYRAAVFMHKEVGLLEVREAENNATSTSTSAPSMDHIHAQVSFKMDVFLS
jgi:hypothetical protein